MPLYKLYKYIITVKSQVSTLSFLLFHWFYIHVGHIVSINSRSRINNWSYYSTRTSLHIMNWVIFLFSV